MEQMTVNDVVKAAKGRLLCGDKNLPLLHISIDSRKVNEGDLFVPLIGEHSDAHAYLGQALSLGAAAVLTSEHDQMEDTHAWIRVEDTKKALQAVGAYYRDRLTLPLVGITGSVGKTTTREMIGAALSAGYRVYKTPKNLNSQVGVPLTLSEITPEDEIGVLELGMSMAGEMTVIAGIARVDAAVITNVGITHIEQLGSRENIYREKLAIQDGMREDGILFLNGDDPLLGQTKARGGRRTIYFGTGENSDYRAEDIRLEEGYPVFTAVCGSDRIPVRLGVMGRHNVVNAMAALAVADAYQVPLAAAAKALEAFEGFQNRQEKYERNGITIIDDTYNASPVSMLAELEVLESMKQASRRIAVLADMKELGPDGAAYHRQIGEWLSVHPPDMLFTLGELAGEIEAATVKGGRTLVRYHFDQEDREGLYEKLVSVLKPGDCVMLKGSNSMKLGEVASRLVEYESGVDSPGKTGTVAAE